MPVTFTAGYIEVWRDGALLSRHRAEREAVEAILAHAETAVDGDYEIRTAPVKVNVKRKITGPDAPALGPVLTISDTALTVTLDRAATGPTRIDRYELERLSGETWSQIASGISIFGAGNAYPDTSLLSSTVYYYRCRAVDTTGRVSEYSYATGVTTAAATNQSPVWDVGTISLSVEAGSSVSAATYCADPEGSALLYSLVSTDSATITVTAIGGIQTTAGTPVGVRSVTLRASDGATSADKAISVTVSAVSLPATSDTPDYVDPVGGVTLLGGRTTVYAAPATVGTGSGTTAGNAMALTTALANSAAGQTIQLIAGTYAGTYALTKTVPGNNPIIVKGVASFLSIVTGTWTMTGARQIVTGIQFSGSSAKCTVGGTNNKLIGNKLTGWGNGNAISAGRSGAQCEIAYNEIYSPSAWVIGESAYPYRAGLRTVDDGSADFHYGGWLHHNHFHDFPDKPSSSYGSGQSDAIEIGETIGGTYPNINSGWYVESNLIKDHLQGTSTGAANVDLKVGGVVARYNTFINSAGHFDVRAGSYHGCTIESNYIPDSGMYMHGRGNRLIGNYSSGGLRLMAGNQAIGANGVAYPPSENALVVGNIAPITVGYYWSSSTPTLPCADTTIRDQPAGNGSITIKPSSPTVGGYATGTIDQRNSAAGINFAVAVALTTSDVGPSAISSASAAYKAARGL